MKSYIIKSRDLDATLLQKWISLQKQSADYQSPFYHPRYTQIVGNARNDVHIAVFELDNQIVGFLPFHRLGKEVGKPIGEFLSDYQGPIVEKDCELSGVEMLQAMQLRYFPFDHVPLAKREFNSYAWRNSRSTLIDIPHGYEAYKQSLAALHGTGEAGVFKELRVKERRLHRAHKAMRFEMSTIDGAAFQSLLTGKAEQIIRTLGARRNWLSLAWVNQVLEEIRQEQNMDFGGVLSTLYVDDELITAQFGMRSGTTLHWWLPWYRVDFGAFSPGIILLDHLAKDAQLYGIKRIDMGRGEQPYKLRFANGQIDLGEGALAKSAALWQIARSASSTRYRLRDSIVGKTWRRTRNVFIGLEMKVQGKQAKVGAC